MQNNFDLSLDIVTLIFYVRFMVHINIIGYCIMFLCIEHLL